MRIGKNRCSALGGKELLGQLDHGAGEQQQCDEVGDAHQAVEGVGDAPQQAQVHGRAQNGHEGVHHKEGLCHLVAVAEEHQEAGAVQTPADDGGKGKAAKRHGGKDGSPAAVGGGKAGDGQLCTGCGAVVHGGAAAQDDHGGQGADDDGVSKHLKDAEHALLHRLFGVGAGMGDGAGAKAGLIGKDAAGDALLHADEQAADGAAGEGSWVEGTGHDGLQHIGQAGQVEPYYAHSQHDVEQRHEGHQLFAHAADALDAAQQHHGHQHGHDDARDEVQRAQETAAHHTVFQQGGVHSGHDGVDLGGIAGAEHGQHAEQRVQKCQELPAFAQTVLDVIHGAAHPLAGLTALTEMHGQGHLGKLGAHAQQRGAPHPEHGTRAADGNGACHTGDVAGAHGAGQCGAHRLEGGHGTVRSVLFAEHASDGGFDGVREFADLQKAGAYAQQQTHTNDAHHGGHAPDKVVDRRIDGRDRLDHNSSHILCKVLRSDTFCQRNIKTILPYFCAAVK